VVQSNSQRATYSSVTYPGRGRSAQHWIALRSITPWGREEKLWRGRAAISGPLHGASLEPTIAAVVHGPQLLAHADLVSVFGIDKGLDSLEAFPPLARCLVTVIRGEQGSGIAIHALHPGQGHSNCGWEV
jgi:hypothetical protein